MKLITELTEEIEIVTEGVADEKKYYITGPFAQSEKDNRNGRSYARPVLEGAINDYIGVYVNQHRALGELNHPPTPAINPERAAIKIESLVWDGNNVIGRAKVLTSSDFPCGRIVKGLMDEGIKFGVSTRGMGTLKPNSRGINEVQSDFRLRAVDVVHDPSGPDCWVQGIMEGVDWVYDAATGNYQAQQMLEDTRNQLKRMTTKQIGEQTLALWSKFLKTL